jgi:hypothetical protein
LNLRELGCGTDFDELTLHPEPKKKVDAKKKIHGPNLKSSISKFSFSGFN